MTPSTAASDAAAMLRTGGPFITSGGLETALYYSSSFPLRQEAAFEALLSPKWNEYLYDVLKPFADLAVAHQLPIVLETETWRASRRWFDDLNTPDEDRKRVHRVAMEHVSALAKHVEVMSSGNVTVVVQGIIGPRADAYTEDEDITLGSAREYHREQIAALKDSGLTLVTAMTLTTSTEAIAIAHEANEAGLACIISFTLETDGRLPSGEILKDAVMKVEATVQPQPEFYMINCVHPVHVRPVFEQALAAGETWAQRVKGIRGNSSAKSHEELDESTELDEGNPKEWAKEMVALRELLPSLTVLGGCCGTGPKHCDEISRLLK